MRKNTNGAIKFKIYRSVKFCHGATTGNRQRIVEEEQAGNAPRLWETWLKCCQKGLLSDFAKFFQT